MERYFLVPEDELENLMLDSIRAKVAIMSGAEDWSTYGECMEKFLDTFNTMYSQYLDEGRYDEYEAAAFLAQRNYKIVVK